MHRFNRCVALLLSASIGFAGAAQGAQAVLIGTAQVADAQGVVSVDMDAAAQRTQVLSYLDRPEVVAGLTERGVSADGTVATILHPWNEDIVAEEGIVAAADWPTLAGRLEAQLAPLRRAGQPA